MYARKLKKHYSTFEKINSNIKEKIQVFKVLEFYEKLMIDAFVITKIQFKLAGLSGQVFFLQGNLNEEIHFPS